MWSSPGFNRGTNLLFSLYSVRIFTDGTIIFFINNNAKGVEFTMNEELKLVLKYFTINKLSLNQ